jgi:septum formation protein
MLQIPKIILASRSPARAALLSQIHIPYIAIPSELDENRISTTPNEYVLEIAQEKAGTIRAKFQDELGEFIVIGCDTIIVGPNQQVLGKPRNRKEAKHTLLSLSNKIHTVLTGCVMIIFPSQVQYNTVVSTSVKFRELSLQEVNYYLDKNEWMNRAGGYAIQGLGAILIQEIQGDFYNVIGLPVNWIWDTLLHHYGTEIFFNKNNNKD